ncbi:MAG: WD40/YVTN/BNR-like repeat-containing protein [Acidobacteriota bacterium]
MKSALALAVMFVTSTAYANGRPPLTNGVYFRPGDPHSLYVRTTFGLLISHDDGCTMSWVCEQNIGYGGTFDPKYAIASDGTIYATSPSAGLRVSRDGGCTFTTHPSLPADSWTDSVDIGPTGEVWVVTATSGASNNVYSSTDGGTTFQARGMLSATIWWKSVKIAKSNPLRVYVGGYEVAGALPDGGMAPLAHLAHTDDDGAHWTESALAGVLYGPVPTVIVNAVDPQNPDIVYVTSIGANQSNGDRLYRSTDAGMTLTEVLATTDGIRDVVIRDANTVLVATQMGGSFVSTNGGQSFGPMANPPQLNCLGQRDDGTLIGCGANWAPDNMAVAKSADAGGTWQKVWRFVELYGPLAECPAGTPEHDTCGDQLWPNIKAQFGCTGPACGALQGQVYGASPADTTPVKKKAGCCDASGGAAGGSLVWAAFAWVWLRRKRK